MDLINTVILVKKEKRKEAQRALKVVVLYSFTD